ncbi:MAG: response regulator [Rhodoplanes sp.]|uniref:GAF domain-containing hybrid sensor histidine kinase/response regulator n=1 Tax=Rhodoplanes sp. TaxID=1968906 RepID=UPI00182AD750|nr:response regulator [Rhodoplanes sp.]NVO14858.1 response regulator [Rhodoplanes sp.]
MTAQGADAEPSDTEPERVDIITRTFQFLAGGGEMGALMRAHDWTRSPLGPPERWPDALKMAVSICLNSRFPMLIWWGPDFVMLYNDAYRPILGMTKHPASLGRPGRVIWPETWSITGPQLDSIWQGEATWSHDVLLPLDRNNYLEEAYFTYSYSPIKHADGRIGGVFTAVTETTERVLGERRLRILRELASQTAEARTVEHASRRIMDVLGANNPDIPVALLYLVDEERSVLQVAGACGVPAEKYPAEVGFDDDDPWCVARAIRAAEPVLLDYLPFRFGSLTGTVWPEPVKRALVLPVPRLGVAGAVCGAVVVGINPRRALDDDYRGFLELVAGHVATAMSNARATEEERRRTDELVRLEARFRDLADSAPVMIWLSDPGGLCTWFNRPWLVFTGRGLEDELGEGWLAGVHPDDRSRCAAVYRSALDQREPFRVEFRLRRHDGEWCQVDDTGVPHYAADGAFLGFIGSCVDVSGARRFEAALRKSREDLLRLNETLETRVAERTEDIAAANRQLLAQIEEREQVEATLRQMQRLDAVGQLTSGVAHDFNNLLTVILGNASYLEKLWAEADDPKLMRRITHIRIAAERGAKLIAQLLAFSRRQRLEPCALDLNETVGKMHELLATTMGGGIELETVLAPTPWAALVDPTQLELVVLNLAINARDAMQVGGRLTVRTANVVRGDPQRPEQPAAGEYVELAVVDTGTGMADEVLAKAFEPFFTTKTVGKGSGLGLSQVLGFAKQSGGGVAIETVAGQGTTVRVFFPRAPVTDEADASASPDAPAGAAASACVLVVDDDDDVRHITASMLEGLGHRVVEAGSGGAALERLAARDDIDIALIDFAMPGMSGLDLAREARMRRPALPIVFITGYADSTVLAGVRHEHILRKPFLDVDLDRRIRATLANTRAGSLDALMSTPR